jgi:CheY-like chemotaxis protein
VLERTALVVEDDDRAADLVRLLLESEGFTVIRAASAEAALVFIAGQVPDLIMLDLHLPGMRGEQMLDQVRGDARLSSVPVVIISSSLPEGSVAKLGGAAAVLRKPISRVQLRISLADLGLHPSPEHRRTVLVVDDDPKAVDVIAAFLPAPAYQVVRVYGGLEAIIEARRLRPDLILLDLQMPDVNGFDVVAALRQLEETAEIPILVVTAKRISDQDLALLNGNHGDPIRVVEKAGFNRAVFLAEVKRALLNNPEAA